MHLTSRRTAEVAKERGLDVEAILVEGNHFSMVPPAMKQSIAFFEKQQGSPCDQDESAGQVMVDTT